MTTLEEDIIRILKDNDMQTSVDLIRCIYGESQDESKYHSNRNMINYRLKKMLNAGKIRSVGFDDRGLMVYSLSDCMRSEVQCATLKPCPFCGSRPFRYTESGEDVDTIYYIMCENCGGQMESRVSMQSAEEQWNKRVRSGI